MSLRLNCMGRLGMLSGRISSVGEVHKLARQFLRHRHRLATLEQIDADDSQSDPVRDRLAKLAREMAHARAESAPELAAKAAVLLDWLDPQETDIPNQLAVSLCRDIVLLFPVRTASGRRRPKARWARWPGPGRCG